MTLKNIIPAHLRKKVYGIYALIGTLIGAIQVGFASAGEEQPKAILVALAVYAYLGVALGATARANTGDSDLP